MYDDLSFEIKYMNKNLRNIVGESHVSNCDTSTNQYSKCTNANAASFLHLLFVLIIKSISNYDENLTKTMKMKSSTFEKADDIDPITSQKKYDLDDVELVNQDDSDQSGGANVDGDYTILEKLEEINTRRKITLSINK